MCLQGVPLGQLTPEGGAARTGNKRSPCVRTQPARPTLWDFLARVLAEQGTKAKQENAE